MEVSSIILTTIQYFKNPLLDKFSDWGSDIERLFNDGILPYLDSFYYKFYYAKTFLHRQEKQDFYELYFPMRLSHNGKKISTNSINELFLLSNHITVIGTAGSGKSMLVKHLFLNSINEKFKIPIIVELRKVETSDSSIFDYIRNFLFQNNLAKNDRIIEKILKSGTFIFLLDGFDEIKSENKEKITNDIEDFVDVYNKNFYLITSRPGADIELMPRFVNTYINSLTESEIEKFVKQQVSIWGTDLELAQRINETIFTEKNIDYKSILNNPLLLSMYILGFENNPSIPYLLNDRFI